MKQLEKHPLNILPDCTLEDYRRRRQSIQTHGFNPKFPIYLYEGMVLDGWQRYRACTQLKADPISVEFEGTEEEAIQFVRETNIRRRLTDDQMATFIVDSNDLLGRYKDEAKKRMGRTAHPEGRAKDKAASDYGTSRKKIDRAERLKNQSPDKFEQVKSGEKKLYEVEKEAAQPEVELTEEEIFEQAVNKILKDIDNIIKGADTLHNKIVSVNMTMDDLNLLHMDNGIDTVLSIGSFSRLFQAVSRMLNRFGVDITKENTETTPIKRMRRTTKAVNTSGTG